MGRIRDADKYPMDVRLAEVKKMNKAKIDELKAKRREITAEIKRLEEEQNGIHCGSFRCQKKQSKNDEQEEYILAVFNPNRNGRKGVYYPFMYGHTKKEITDFLLKLINDANNLRNKLMEGDK